MCNEFVEKIKEKVDFKSGNLKKISSEQYEIYYKLNISLVLYFSKMNLNLWYYVTRNGEQISCIYTDRKIDDKFFKSLQHLVNEIENGSFNHKKTESEKIAEIIQNRRLTSYMNNTKWTEFIHAMDEEMPCNIPFDLKTLFEDDHFELYDRFYDDECFNNYDFKSIEWVKVKPKFCDNIHRGMLISDEEIPHDFTEEFINLMKKYSIPYEYDEINEVYIIYGYK